MRAIECKSSATHNPRYFDALNKIAASELCLDAHAQAIMYGGELETGTDRGAMVPYARLGTWLGLDA